MDRREYCKSLTIATKNIYESIVSVYSHALKENVVFNAKGFHHLLFKSNGTPRTIEERIYKLKLIPFAKSVIEKAMSVEEERNLLVRVSRKKNIKLKQAKAYSLVVGFRKNKSFEVRVILMRIGNGSLAFRSIMKN